MMFVRSSGAGLIVRWLGQSAEKQARAGSGPLPAHAVSE